MTDYLDDIAAAFAQVIDSKSPYTSGHSERVTLFTDMIAEELRHCRLTGAAGSSAPRCCTTSASSASATPSSTSPASSTTTEWAAMKMHAAHSETILSRIEAFRDLAAVAGAHHERLDGKGYPRGLKGDEIVLETRIITTADIFDALTADRPYRRAMPVSKALAIMSDMVGTAIDPDCLQALRRALRRVDQALAA